ncbi:MAG TPA: ribulose-phosphate 3-epimerase [Pirellulaceae bacterium]|nr:ribulose-phosphate 3-epimerase [Pirellulaceae bacterium]HMO92093.1 ribulose-phosphate 3-epimerase [Pirellulaceae bacterium]HMP69319.1 ribulose-phosphate 3-epimerase [Pirellulaceae bacterium]
MSRRERVQEVRRDGLQLLPSLLLCDFANLGAEIHAMEDAGIQVLHLDVMDGDFVPNFTYGMPIVEAIRRVTDLVLDVHLMISKPERYLGAFYDAGADVITFHAEAVDDPLPLLRRIRKLGAASGLAINPQTTVASVAHAIEECDLVLPMSIQPGFGGQEFQGEVLTKFAELKELAGPSLILEIDGGVNKQTITRCIEAGAEWFVAGSAIFKQKDYTLAIRDLTQSFGVSNRGVDQIN